MASPIVQAVEGVCTALRELVDAGEVAIPALKVIETYRPTMLRESFEDGISAPGKYVEMRAEMDVVCLISNCPQLNNPCNAYNPTPVRLLVWEGAATRA